MARKFHTKEWAIMMFIANDNDLGSFTDEKIDEIGTVGSTLAADVIVQADTPGVSRVQRVRLTRLGRFMHKLRKFPLPHLQKETNTGDKQTLIRFIDFTLKDFHPIRKMLVIHNHGSGLSIATDEVIGRRRPIFWRAVARRRRVFTDLDAGTQPIDGTDALDNIELKAALTAAKVKHGPLDLLVLDACLMSTFEVAYQLRETTRFIVGSQSNIPALGCRFSKTFEVMRDRSISTADIAKTVVDNAIPELVADEFSAMSALDLANADALAQAISKLAEALTSVLDDAAAFNAITLAHVGALAFIDSETIDLFDFCRRVADTVGDEDVVNAATAVMAAIQSFVIHARPQGAVVKGARGISITLPRKRDVPDAYRRLDFARDTAWVGFLEAYLPKRFPPLAAEPPGILAPPSLALAMTP